MNNECEINSFGIEKSIINDIKKNSIKSFKELSDYYFDELEKLKPVYEKLNKNVNDSIENHTEEYNKMRDSVELLNCKLTIIMKEKTDFFNYYFK